MQIKDIKGRLLYSAPEVDSLKEAAERAVRRRVSLAYADLAGANFAHAFLYKANLAEANIAGAALKCAGLWHANLAGANLHHADLSYADLTCANLMGADLTETNLTGVRLTNARLPSGFRNSDHTDLYILRHQPGIIRAFKLVDHWGYGVYRGGIKYEIGGEYSVAADTDERKDCAAGINLATLSWCLHNRYDPYYRILIAEFTAADIAAIPIGSDGKFRVHRCKIVGEWREDHGSGRKSTRVDERVEERGDAE